MQKFVGDTATLTILRNGQEIELQVIADDVPSLVPLHLYDVPHIPTYFIFGGLVFLPLTRPFLMAYYGINWYANAPLHLSKKATIEYKQDMDEQVIVLSHVLSNDINVGYEGYACRMLLTVDNIEIKNMIQLCQYIDACSTKFIRFDLFQDSVIVLEVQKARESLQDTLKTHSIPYDRSPDLVDVAISSPSSVITTHKTTQIINSNIDEEKSAENEKESKNKNEKEKKSENENKKETDKKPEIAIKT